jgi:hypothetical protein
MVGMLARISVRTLNTTTTGTVALIMIGMRTKLEVLH